MADWFDDILHRVKWSVNLQLVSSKRCIGIRKATANAHFGQNRVAR